MTLRNAPGLDPKEVLADVVPRDHAELVARVTAFEHGVAAFVADHPAITDDATARRATDFIAQLTGLDREIDATRAGLKKPYLAAGRFIDGWFGKLAKRVADAKARAVAVYDPYLNQKAAAERTKWEAVAADRRAEAARLAATAETPDELKRVLALESEALAADRHARNAAAAGRIRGDYGSTGYVATKTNVTITDPDAVPKDYWHHPRVLDALKSVIADAHNAGARDIPGVRIATTTSVRVRRPT